MQKTSRVRHCLLGASILALGLGVTPVFACSAGSDRLTGQDPASDATASAEEEPRRNESSRPMTKQDAYRSALSDYQRLADGWQQHGDDPQALLYLAAALRKDIETLSVLAGADVSIQTNRHEAKVKTVPAEPSGRVAVSAEPSSKEAIEARQRATDQWLGRPIPEAKISEEPLATVTDDHIRELGSRAESQLARLEELWRADSIDNEAVEVALAELETSLRSIAEPSTPPTTIDD